MNPPLNILIELAYLPPVSWMALAWQSPALWLEACENFQKGSYRNRCLIAGPNGIQRLSIPLLKGKHQQTPVRDVRIAYKEPWQQVHWRSIQAAYGNAPFFEYYAEELQSFYQKDYSFLFDFNLELLHFLFQKTGRAYALRFTEQYDDITNLPDTVTDFRNTVSPKTPTPPDWFRPVPYAQVFTERHGFLPDLSALDLLFCCGRQSGAVLSKSVSDALFPNNNKPDP